MAAETKDGNVLEDNEHIVCCFSQITAIVKKKKIKARRRRNDFRSSEEVGKEFKSNNCGISFSNVFNWPEYGILSFEERIYRELCSIAIRNTTNTGIV